MKIALPIIVLALVTLVGCSGREKTDPPDRDGIAPNGRRDLAGLNANIGGIKQGMVYPLYAATRDHRGSGKAYADYGCMGDCSDIRAGYQDAKERGVHDMRQCSAPTWGELEGCVAFTQNLQPQITQLPPATTEH